jgi:hypothetical protein
VRAADPVAVHVAELDRLLRGPGAVKRSMIAEVRNGLHDAAEAYREGGLDPQQAADSAVQDFGPAREVAPLMQEELTARQGRRTALLVAVVFPVMLLGWDLLWQTGHGWTAPVPDATRVLSRVLDIGTVVIAAAALVLLLATFRRAVSRRLTVLAGLVAAGGVLWCNGIAVVMNLINPQQAGAMLTTEPAVTAVALASTAVSALVVRSGIRALRVARAVGRQR